MAREAAVGEVPRERTAAGREAALDHLIRTAAPRAMRIAVRLVGPVDAEDAVQEALARTCRDFARVREPEAWLVRVLVNHCLRVQRRRRVWRWLWLDPPAPAPAPSAHEQLERARAAALLRHHVDRLPTMQRTAIVLRYGEDLSPAEIAAAMGVEETTVKTHLARGLARLRAEMGSHP